MSYGSIHVHDGATAQAMTSTPAKITGFATLGPSANTRDGSLEVVPVLADDQIQVKALGIYEIGFNLSAAFSAAAVVQVHARFGTTEIPHISCSRDVVTTSGVDKHLGYSGSGIYVPATDGYISLYGESSNNGNLTPVHGSLVVRRIG